MNENIKNIAEIISNKEDDNDTVIILAELKLDFSEAIPFATALDKAGYRKQSETVREIYNKIYDNLPQTCDWSWLQGAHWAMQIAAEYGKEE